MGVAGKQLKDRLLKPSITTSTLTRFRPFLQPVEVRIDVRRTSVFGPTHSIKISGRL